MTPENSQAEKMAALALGINDALIELTGALVGLSFALKRHELVALAGLITGVAAALSMAASSYMHARQEINTDAKITAIYTGISYLVVVLFLVAPFFLFVSVYAAMVVMMLIALIIIFLTSWYSSKWRHSPFFTEFKMMLIFGLGVAVISFLVGQLLRRLIGIQV